MENTRITERIAAVINTLNAATLRADQLDAVQRISACVQELKGIIAEVSAEVSAESKQQEN